jgi:Nickel responsive protein SCO4226-like
MQDEGDETWGTYLVEHYGPGSSAETLRNAVRDVRRTTAEMTKQGQSVRYVRATIIPGDEAFMATFEATSETLVREAYVQAGVPLERISPAIEPDGRR